MDQEAATMKLESRATVVAVPVTVKKKEQGATEAVSDEDISGNWKPNMCY